MPPPVDVVRSIHLEKGESLFIQGTTCRAFFFVRSGGLALSAKGQPDRLIPAGSVIDQSELDASGLWATSATATDASDLVVFRGRLLEYFRTDLRIVKRQ
jgi:CRP-like cAMP-binding protein